MTFGSLKVNELFYWAGEAGGSGTPIYRKIGKDRYVSANLTIQREYECNNPLEEVVSITSLLPST